MNWSTPKWTCKRRTWQNWLQETLSYESTLFYIFLNILSTNSRLWSFQIEISHYLADSRTLLIRIFSITSLISLILMPSLIIIWWLLKLWHFWSVLWILICIGVHWWVYWLNCLARIVIMSYVVIRVKLFGLILERVFRFYFRGSKVRGTMV